MGLVSCQSTGQIALSLQHIADHLVVDAEVALPIGIAGICLGEPLGKSEPIAKGRQRFGELSLRHQHIADQIERHRGEALELVVAGIGVAQGNHAVETLRGTARARHRAAPDARERRPTSHSTPIDCAASRYCSGPPRRVARQWQDLPGRMRRPRRDCLPPSPHRRARPLPVKGRAGNASRRELRPPGVRADPAPPRLFAATLPNCRGWHSCERTGWTAKPSRSEARVSAGRAGPCCRTAPRPSLAARESRCVARQTSRPGRRPDRRSRSLSSAWRSRTPRWS